MNKGIYFIALIGGLLLAGCSGSNSSTGKDGMDYDSVAVEEVVAVVEDITPADTWTIKHYVDDFGEETNEGYILNVAYGEFSNSATTNSQLTVRIIADADDIRFDMYEYGSHFMKGEGTLQFRAKLPDDSEVRFTTYNYDNGVNSVKSSDVKKVRQLFETYPRLRFAARTTSSYSTSTYRFVYEGNPEEFKTKLAQLTSE